MTKGFCAIICVFTLVAGALLAGCSSPSPYQGHRSWAVNQSATPPYAADYDLLYFYPATCDWRTAAGETNIAAVVDARLRAFGYAGEALERDYRHPRLFAPYFGPEAPREDVAMALEYYLDNFHESGRMFAVVAEGWCVDVVRSVLEEELGAFGSVDRDDGYLAAFFCADAGAVETGELDVFHPMNAPNGHTCGAMDMDALDSFLRRFVTRYRLSHDWERRLPVDTANIPENILEAWHEREE